MSNHYSRNKKESLNFRYQGDVSLLDRRNVMTVMNGVSNRQSRPRPMGTGSREPDVTSTNTRVAGKSRDGRGSPEGRELKAVPIHQPVPIDFNTFTVA